MHLKPQDQNSQGAVWRYNGLAAPCFKFYLFNWKVDNTTHSHLPVYSIFSNDSPLTQLAWLQPI